MKPITLFSTALFLLWVLALSSHAWAGENPGDASAQPLPASMEMTDGVVRKVDKGNHKITIRHGEIKNLDMPGMTMVFRVKNPDLLEKVQAGDKVKFRAEKSGSAMVVTDIKPEK